MQLFITGTSTDIGKTFIASWLCLHFKFQYFKPIQSGFEDGTDTNTVKKLAKCIVHKETYIYKTPCSPHLAAKIEGEVIDPYKIQLPENTQRLVVEGAGGTLVPINDNFLIIDLIKHLNLPTVVVASSKLGTINHTLLTLEALRARSIPILGVIMNGTLNQDNAQAIEFYGKIAVLDQIPMLDLVNYETLSNITPSQKLQEVLK